MGFDVGRVAEGTVNLYTSAHMKDTRGMVNGATGVMRGFGANDAANTVQRVSDTAHQIMGYANAANATYA